MSTRNSILKSGLAAAFIGLALPLQAADHLDSPSVQADGRLDINDLYAFQSPTNPDNSVLIMTVNPVAGVLSPTTLNPQGVYQLHIDNNGDVESDVSFSFYFSKPKDDGSQNMLVLREDNSVYASGSTGETVTTSGGAQITVGVYDDPFFFDLAGFQNGFAFTGDDFFAGLNVTAIVLEVPSSVLNGADSNIAVWARTTSRGDQFDRMGRPAISTALISSGQKDAYNAGDPTDDFEDFGAGLAATIATLNGGDTPTADAIAAILLPDVLTFDTSSAAGFLNGRKLADDVLDAELNLLTNGALTTDGVDANDVPFQAVFPYLAPAN